MSEAEHDPEDVKRSTEADYLTFVAGEDTIHVQGVVDGETVFFAEPEAKRSEPVIRAAMRTWGRRAFPELADEANGDRDDGNGGAFQ